ncbi:MAG: hypothetical protein A2015_15080 [Spirochaetes bacterium GWF1_31_7]|nr:MAG: hypothetical protein A2Y30_11505 [Spirochaetes bacterium GWE1_32_154]OHD51146.1 MAG: hypothetical protein A2Y29_01045 [Spirochaetes bacterium GWE2_31_10]OHD52065.1 MAG: hypothetical protein A2015_15080 [Spirochaetes bacterium GWF1_31_7]HBD96474.1 hypothetical protein [Spirochaetia bacterium]
MRDINLTNIQAKSGIHRAIVPEIFLITLYRSLAPYRGCSHGCLYCDGRAEKYFVEGNFESDIAVRNNLIELVTRDIAKGVTAREYGALSFSSGVTDVYQPVEEKYGLSRQLLKALLPAQLPLVILTKNDLVLRDFDILSQFPEVLIMTTITTLDTELSDFLEPDASSPNKRLDIIKKAKEHGFHTGVLTMPLCPGLTDDVNTVQSLFETLKNAGADFISPGNLTLRPGCQKDLFMHSINNSYPHLNNLYTTIYSEERQSGMPRLHYTKPLYSTYLRILADMKMPSMIPHSIYKKFLTPPDYMYVLLCHMNELYSNRGVNTAPLKKATLQYGEWLKTLRSGLRRKRLPVDDNFVITRIMTEKLCESNLETVLGNKKLADLFHTILGNDVCFDYTELKLV